MLLHKLPVKRLHWLMGSTARDHRFTDPTLALTVWKRGRTTSTCATSYDDVQAYTPAWAEHMTGVSRSQLFASPGTPPITLIKRMVVSMIIVGAGLNHSGVSPRYELLCPSTCRFSVAVSVSGGGWAHDEVRDLCRSLAVQPLAFAFNCSVRCLTMSALLISITTPASGRYDRYCGEIGYELMVDNRHPGLDRTLMFCAEADWLDLACIKSGTSPLDYCWRSGKAG
ncbi:hypothetical protein ACNKHX_07590 [Shigella flexneri]